MQDGKRSTLFIAALLASVAPAAWAQTPDAGASNEGEIVVTAQRREERLQDVPVAVSAFSASQLENNGVVRLEDLTRVAPSFQTSRFVGRADAVSFGIRGQRLGDVRITNDPSVVTYIAEVPQMRPFGLGITGALDIRSVEVLRGPQGTLFGRNSTGGAVLITPNLPTDEFEGSARLSLGNYERVGGEVVLSGPLTETLSARIAVTSSSRDGWLENRGPFDDLNSEDYTAARGVIRWEPTSRVESILYADYFDFEGSGQSGVLRAVNPAGTANRYPLPTGGGAVLALQEQLASDFFSARTSVQTRAFSNGLGISNTTNFDINDDWTLRNVVGYRRVTSKGFIDVDDTLFSILQTDQYSHTTQWSEELQVQYDGERFDFIAGGFAFQEEGDDGGIGTFFAGIAPAKFFNQDGENSSHSLFAEGAYDVTTQFTLTAGVRQTYDEREFTTRVRNGANCAVRTDANVPYSPCVHTESVEFDQLTWNLTGQYNFTADQQMYLSARRGYRTGGFNVGAETDSQMIPYNPEIVDTYEIGYKGVFDTVRLGVALYSSDYSDIQKSVNRCVLLPGATTCSLQTAIENAAAATIRGAEVELTWTPIDDLTLGSFYTYTDASYDEWNSVGAGGVIVDLSGNRFGYLPEHKAGLSARYRLPLSLQQGDIFIAGNAAYQSEQQLDELSAPGVDQEAYTLFGARLEWNDFLRPGLTLALWGNNLTNEEYFIGSNNVYASAGFTSGYVGEPRTYGLDLRAEF
jgi:iron complex outermembrane receptor protein